VFVPKLQDIIAALEPPLYGLVIHVPPLASSGSVKCFSSVVLIWPLSIGFIGLDPVIKPIPSDQFSPGDVRISAVSILPSNLYAFNSWRYDTGECNCCIRRADSQPESLGILGAYFILRSSRSACYQKSFSSLGAIPVYISLRPGFAAFEAPNQRRFEQPVLYLGASD
jgi:hypothetical protein